MSLFLSDVERAAFHAFRKCNPVGQDLFWALCNRVEKRAESPGLTANSAQSEWWFCAAEYLSDAAMVHALKPSQNVSVWLREVTLGIIRRPVSDWVGPAFRNHATKEPRGHLETAHLSWSVAVVLDLAPVVFTEPERDELRKVLRDRAIPLCQSWIDQNNHLANWRCVLAAGVAVAAAVLDQTTEIDQAVQDYHLNVRCFQPDGSYGESLQYGNYAALCLMLTREALMRRQPALESVLSLEPWGRSPRWQAASLFYNKPLAGWSASPCARSANFNDSGAIFRPSADVLLHIAKHGKTTRPHEAGLARWLFDQCYAPDLSRGPHDGASFGFVNDFGFLSVPLLPHAADAMRPVDAGLPECVDFSCGDVLVRDAWDGKTVLAIHGGGDPLSAPGHLHGDLNSFILVHNQERLLVDPGHSCYRNLIHGLEGSTGTHNTCTFHLESRSDLGLHDRKPDNLVLEQSRSARVHFNPISREVGKLADRGARRLLAARLSDITAVGSDAAGLYDPVIQQFSRFWILCGTHVLFVVDRIVATQPVRTSWHWLLNNRDGKLDLKTCPPDRLVARRGNAGMKLFNLGNAHLTVPEHAYVHDAYHPHPAGTGEGRPGSGQLITFQEFDPANERTSVHALALDSYGGIAAWHLKSMAGLSVIEGPGAGARWGIATSHDASSIEIRELASNRHWTVGQDETGTYVLKEANHPTTLV